MPSQPNVLLITSDQHHFSGLGCVNPKLKTPNLDRLAAMGVRCESWHGCWTIGTKLGEDVPTVGDLFREAGYFTALLGKAHFQPLRSESDQTSLETPDLFRDRGFWRRFDGPWYGFEHVQINRNHGDEFWAGQHYGTTASSSRRRPSRRWCGHRARVVRSSPGRALPTRTRPMSFRSRGHRSTTPKSWSQGRSAPASTRKIRREDLLRVPFLAAWPGKIPEGRTTKALTSLIDLPTTFLSACGLDVPGQLQGVDQLPVWTGAAERAREWHLTEFRHQPTKLSLRTLITERYKLTLYRGADYGELFDLETDPSEKNNLWAEPSAQDQGRAAAATRAGRDRARADPFYAHRGRMRFYFSALRGR